MGKCWKVIIVPTDIPTAPKPTPTEPTPIPTEPPSDIPIDTPVPPGGDYYDFRNCSDVYCPVVDTLCKSSDGHFHVIRPCKTPEPINVPTPLPPNPTPTPVNPTPTEPTPTPTPVDPTPTPVNPTPTEPVPTPVNPVPTPTPVNPTPPGGDFGSGYDGYFQQIISKLGEISTHISNMASDLGKKLGDISSDLKKFFTISDASSGSAVTFPDFSNSDGKSKGFEKGYKTLCGENSESCKFSSFMR